MEFRLHRRAATLPRARWPRQGTACFGRVAGHRGTVMMVSAGTGSHQDYVRWRSRQIAYGRWEPWADAGPVREHVRQLRRAGGSYQAIAQAAGVATMTVYRLVHG